MGKKLIRDKIRDEIRELAPTIEVVVEAKHLMVEHEDGTKQGLTTFRAFCTDVTDLDGNVVGSIGGGIGAVVISVNKREWTIGHDDLWYAVAEAIERKEKS